MSASARARGEALEARVLDREPYEPVEQREGADADWCDAHAPSGRPVEIKACALEKSHGPDRTIAGEFWIPRRNHRRLLDARGYYHLVVYDGADDPRIVQEARLPAQLVDVLLGAWTPVGDRSGSCADEATSLPHTRVFGRDGR